MELFGNILSHSPMSTSGLCIKLTVYLDDEHFNFCIIVTLSGKKIMFQSTVVGSQKEACNRHSHGTCRIRI